MNTINAKRICAVISIVLSVLLIGTLFLTADTLTPAEILLFALIPAAQIWLSLDFMKYLHRDEEKELIREDVLRRQKKENEELHAEHVKQKFELRMQRYDENALHRKQKMKRSSKKKPDPAEEISDMDPEELKVLLTKDHRNRDDNTSQQIK